MSDVSLGASWAFSYRRSVTQAARKGLLLVAVGVREGRGFDVLDWRAASEPEEKNHSLLLSKAPSEPTGVPITVSSRSSSLGGHATDATYTLCE
jgi:hypothetical protein